MRHNEFGKKLNRDTNQRKALYRSMVSALIEHERIVTTDVKAKQIRRFAEQLITLGKKGTLPARRRASETLRDTLVRKLFDDLAPRFKARVGGYTRITKIGRRMGDGAELAVLEFLGDGKAAVSDAPAAAE